MAPKVFPIIYISHVVILIGYIYQPSRKPLLEMVLEREKNHNWETGKKAIEAFLAKTSNK